MKRLMGLGAGLIVLGALLLLPGPVAAGGGAGGGPCSGFSSGERLIMRDNCFDGVAHFVTQGTALLVENDGELPHSFTAVDGSFDSGILGPGESTTINLGEDGVQKVICTLHGPREGAGMAGVLLVGQPQVSDIGEAFGLAGRLSAHDARVTGELERQSKSLAQLEESVRQMQLAQRNEILLTLVAGGVVAIVVLALAQRRARVLQGIGRESALAMAETKQPTL